MTVATDARLSSLDRMLNDSQVGDTFATDMFAVVDALESSPTLRRAVTDPGTPEGARQGLVHGLLDGKVDRAVADFVAEAATLRWAGGRTFAAALERQAVRAVLIVADRRGELEDTEDQLFRFARFVESNPDLRNVLADRSIDRSRRQELIGELLERPRDRRNDHAREAGSGGSRADLRAHDRGLRHVGRGTEESGRGNRPGRQAAHLRPTRPARAALTKQIGREVAIQEVIDPDILGGVRVELGDEVFEGTVVDRLEAARRLFG